MSERGEFGLTDDEIIMISHLAGIRARLKRVSDSIMSKDYGPALAEMVCIEQTATSVRVILSACAKEGGG